MTTPFGTFTPRAQQTGDRLQARACIGRPLLIQVTGFDPSKQTTDPQTKAQVLKPAIFVDVWDFLGGPAIPTLGIEAQPPNTVYIGAMWMSGPIVDNLKDSLGGPPMPVRIVSKRGAKNGFSFLNAVPLGNPEYDSDPNGPMQLQAVTQAFMADPQRFDRERAARLAAAQAAQQPVQGFAPSNTAPTPQQYAQPQQAGGMAGWNGQQTMHPAAAGFPGGVPQAMELAQQAAQFAQAGLPTNGFAGQPMQAPAAAQYQPPAPEAMTPGAMVNAGQMTPAQAVQAYTQPPAQPQFQPPAPPAGGTQAWAAQNPDLAQQQAAQYQPSAGFPGMPQGAPAQAPNGQPGMQVNNTDVAKILAGLQGQAPAQ